MVEIGGGLLVWFFARFVGEGAMRELVYCGSSLLVVLIMKEVLHYQRHFAAGVINSDERVDEWASCWFSGGIVGTIEESFWSQEYVVVVPLVVVS